MNLSLSVKQFSIEKQQYEIHEFSLCKVLLKSQSLYKPSWKRRVQHIPRNPMFFICRQICPDFSQTKIFALQCLVIIENIVEISIKNILYHEYILNIKYITCQTCKKKDKKKAHGWNCFLNSFAPIQISAK